MVYSRNRETPSLSLPLWNNLFGKLLALTNSSTQILSPFCPGVARQGLKKKKKAKEDVHAILIYPLGKSCENKAEQVALLLSTAITLSRTCARAYVSVSQESWRHDVLNIHLSLEARWSCNSYRMQLGKIWLAYVWDANQKCCVGERQQGCVGDTDNWKWGQGDSQKRTVKQQSKGIATECEWVSWVSEGGREWERIENQRACIERRPSWMGTHNTSASARLTEQTVPSAQIKKRDSLGRGAPDHSRISGPS